MLPGRRRVGAPEAPGSEQQIYMFIMDCQQRITVGGASCACVSQRDSMGLHDVGGRMREFRLLYLLCMLRFPVPLHSLHAVHKHMVCVCVHLLQAVDTFCIANATSRR
jgi:hypothetical protein